MTGRPPLASANRAVKKTHTWKVTNEKDLSLSTPARTTGEPRPAPPRRTGRSTNDKSPAASNPALTQTNATQALVAAMPHNANKALDFGRDNAVNPPLGMTAAPTSDTVSASTLSEGNASAKTGEPAAPGAHAIDGRLAQARVDGSGQVLTTNQGVAIADNQNSLKAGLRGPARACAAGRLHPARKDHPLRP